MSAWSRWRWTSLEEPRHPDERGTPAPGAGSAAWLPLTRRQRRSRLRDRVHAMTQPNYPPRPPSPWLGSRYETRHRWQLDGARTLEDAARGTDRGHRPLAGLTSVRAVLDDQRTMRDRMLAGELYLADDPVLERESQRAMALMEAFNRSPASDPEERRRLLTELLGAFGEGSQIRPPFYCDYGYQTHLGARTFANFGLVALDVARITIGDDV